MNFAHEVLFINKIMMRDRRRVQGFFDTFYALYVGDTLAGKSAKLKERNEVSGNDAMTCGSFADFQGRLNIGAGGGNDAAVLQERAQVLNMLLGMKLLQLAAAWDARTAFGDPAALTSRAAGAMAAVCQKSSTTTR